MLRLVISLTLLLLVAPLAAQQEPPSYNRVSLTESATVEVDNDLLVVTLFAQAEGRDAATPADEVNGQIDWAIDQVKGHADIRVQTLGYNTHPVYNKSNLRGWRVKQSLRLESRDSRLLGDLIGRLQERLKVQSITYQVSEQQRRKHLDDLTAEALKRFTARAQHVAQALGRSGFRMVQLHIDDGQNRPMPLARGMMMEAQADTAAAPARIEAGTQQMTVSIRGEIELSEP